MPAEKIKISKAKMVPTLQLTFLREQMFSKVAGLFLLCNIWVYFLTASIKYTMDLQWCHSERPRGVFTAVVGAYYRKIPIKYLFTTFEVYFQVKYPQETVKTARISETDLFSIMKNFKKSSVTCSCIQKDKSVASSWKWHTYFS